MPDWTDWLDLASTPFIGLLEHHRAYALDGYEDDNIELITLIGSQRKCDLIQSLFSLPPIENHKKILLRRVPRVIEAGRALLVADCEVHNAERNFLAPGLGIESHVFQWSPGPIGPTQLSTLAHLVYTQLLRPFSTCMCIFATDLGGTKEVAKILSYWLSILSGQEAFPATTFPPIFVLVDWNTPSGFDEKLATTDFIVELRREIGKLKELKESYQSLADVQKTNPEFEHLLGEKCFRIKVLPLPGKRFSRTHLQTLQTRLLHESKDTQTFQSGNKRSFRGKHFGHFFSSACAHLAKNITTPFDFVLASRIPNPIPEFGESFKEFLKLIPTQYVKSVIPQVVASALCLDNFPPGAHAFDSTLVFQVLYSTALQKSLATFPNASIILELIKSEFTKPREHFRTAHMHKALLESFDYFWSTISSSWVCLFCLCRKPDIILPCKHGFCDTCVVILGEKSHSDPWRIIFGDCPLCNTPTQVEVQLKPATAGVRCLAIDGGSHYDFQFLETIQMELDKMKLPIDIKQMFDYVNGSGLGVWAILENFCKPSNSFEEGLNAAAFRKAINAPTGEVPISRWSVSTRSSERSFWKAVPRWSDTIKSTNTIVSSTNAAFGTSTVCEILGCKVGITVTRIKNGKVCLLSNYHGNFERPTSYEHVRERKVKNELTLSQCARLSLTEKAIAGYGSKRIELPDEIMRIALTEQDLIWNRRNKSPDFLIMLGSHKPVYESTSMKVPFTWLLDFRIYNKINVASSVDEILASQFYIELIELPRLKTDGRLLCYIQIRCRITPTSPAYLPLMQRLRKSSARFYHPDGALICVNDQTLQEAMCFKLFSRRFRVFLEDKDDMVDVKIDRLTTERRSISNCPYRLKDLIEDQDLHCVFGNKYHEERVFSQTAKLF